MSAIATTVPPLERRWRVPGANSVAWPLTVLGTLLAAQFWLIFAKSFNWDEFFHFSMVYQLRAGTLTSPFQTLLMRMLSWAPNVSSDLVTQMLAARVFVWAAFLIGLGALYGLARQFVPRVEAVWATLAYFAAGNVFAHGFAIRTDPIAMATLMLALFLLASRRLGWGAVFAVGALAGFAEMLTVKAIFYAPCFAGIAWLRLSEATDKRNALIRLGAIPAVAAATFAGLFLVHRAGLPPAPHQPGTSFIASGAQWLTQGLLRQPRYTLLAIVTAPVFVLALIKAPSAWRGAALDRDKRIALASLCLPLIVILFYRNVFPYFFVFIMAPAAAAIAPAVAELRKTYGTALLAVALCAIPLGKFIAEPRDAIGNQRAVIDYLHRQFPQPALALDYCGMVADYPRVVAPLVSGLGLAHYRERGIPLVADAVKAGQLPFVIENKQALSLALAGENGPKTLLPADVAALHGNYVRAWGPVWLAGKEIPLGPDAVAIEVPAGGSYVADNPIMVNGAAYRAGEPIALRPGRQIVGGGRVAPTVLWRGERLPAPPPQITDGLLFTDF
jgi:hypothetical protein